MYAPALEELQTVEEARLGGDVLRDGQGLGAEIDVGRLVWLIEEVDAGGFCNSGVEKREER
jgi:hypothetical protein